MPIVRVDDQGEVKKNRRARAVATVSGGVVLAGAACFFINPLWGFFAMLLGTSLASIWNLADDS